MRAGFIAKRRRDWEETRVKRRSCHNEDDDENDDETDDEVEVGKVRVVG